MNIDLKKKIDNSKQFVYNLVKGTVLGNQKARVVLVLDKSGSMKPLFDSGYVQTVVEKITPLAMQFDDDGDFELYLFESGIRKGPTVSLENLENFIKNEILSQPNKYPYGATNYAPAIEQIINDYGVETTKSTGLFGGLFGKKDVSHVTELPTYVIFITDGNNGDKTATKEAIIKASKQGIFFQFVGIGDETFPFLQRLDDLPNRFIDNANFFTVKNFTTVSDDELYKKLLFEFPGWVTLAREKNLIK